LIRSVLGLVYIDLRKHSIESRTGLADNLPAVIGNEVQLQQVILNRNCPGGSRLASGP